MKIILINKEMNDDSIVELSSTGVADKSKFGEITNIGMTIACPVEDAFDFYRTIVYLAEMYGISIIETIYQNNPNSIAPHYIKKIPKNMEFLKRIRDSSLSNNLLN